MTKCKRKHARPLAYRPAPDDPLTLILRNGMRVKQRKDLDLFLSKSGLAYSLTCYGLRRRRVNYTRKRRYGMLSRNGVRNGRRYPYLTFRGGTYSVHTLMMEIWVRPRRAGEEVDHLDGNIDNFRLSNLELVTRKENNRRKAILRKLRRASIDLHDPSLDPRNMSPKQLDEIFNGGV